MPSKFSRFILCLIVLPLVVAFSAAAAQSTKDERVVKNGSVVSLQYTLTGEDGKMIESNNGKEPSSIPTGNTK